MRKRDLLIFIVVTGIVLFIILSYLALSASQLNTKSKPVPSPSPLRISTPVKVLDFSPLPSVPANKPSPSTSIGDAKTNLINSLPIRTPQFNIEYYSEGDIFRITIKENPYSLNQKQAQEWFEQKGVKFNSLNIYWDAYPEVNK